MRSMQTTIFTLSVLAFAIGCTRNAFDESKTLYAPIMLDTKSKTYAGCVKIFDQAEAQTHIQKSRSKKIVVSEDLKSLEIRSSETAVERYFHSQKDCDTYIEDLQYRGWKNHSHSY